MDSAETLKFCDTQERQARMMAELNRLIAIIFDDPVEQGPGKRKEVKK